MRLHVAGTILLIAGLGTMTSTAAFASPGNDDNVRICHRTNAVNNPYTSNTVDPSSIDGIDNDKGKGDHYAEHKGPVFDKDFDYQPPMNGDEWGDIIPPLPDVHNGLNWNATGIAIWNNGCNIPGSTHTATATATETETSTATATETETSTATATETETQTATATATETQTSTATATQTETATATATQTETATATATETATATQTETATATATETTVATETAYVPGPTITVPGANVTETIYVEGPATTETVTQPGSTATVTESNNSTETVYVTEAPQEVHVTETETVKVSETIYIDSDGQRTTAASTTTQAASPSTLPKTGGANLAALGLGAAAALAGATLLFLGRRKPRHN